MLSYGPGSMTRLPAPSVTTRTGIGSRLASLIVHPLPSAVAVSTDVTTTLSFGPSTVLLSHVPATSASLMPPFFAGAGFWAMAAVAEPTASAAVTSRTGRMEESSRDEGTDPAASGGHEPTLRDGEPQSAVGFPTSPSRAAHT